MLFLLNEIETIDNSLLEKLYSNGVLFGKRCFYEIFLKSCVVSTEIYAFVEIMLEISHIQWKGFEKPTSWLLWDQND